MSRRVGQRIERPEGVPESLKYNLVKLKAQASFGATLKEAARQTGEFLGNKISCETIADIVGCEFPPERTLENQTVHHWITNGAKPASIEDAKAVARAFRLSEEYFTRFYRNTVSVPLYEKS